MAKTGVMGKVVSATGAPIAGLTVQAYDVVVLSDRLLAAATTRSTGRFNTSYSIISFGVEPNPHLNLVTIDGGGVLGRDAREHPDVSTHGGSGRRTPADGASIAIGESNAR